jgi:hypothetical protein
MPPRKNKNKNKNKNKETEENTDINDVETRN